MAKKKGFPNGEECTCDKPKFRNYDGWQNSYCDCGGVIAWSSGHPTFQSKRKNLD